MRMGGGGGGGGGVTKVSRKMWAYLREWELYMAYRRRNTAYLMAMPDMPMAINSNYNFPVLSLMFSSVNIFKQNSQFN